MGNLCDECWCFYAGCVLFCGAPIVLFCTGPLVYLHYNQAIGFLATRCSTAESTHRTDLCDDGSVSESCSGFGYSFKVIYHDPREPNSSAQSKKTGKFGYLYPDETSNMPDGGWRYRAYPPCWNDPRCTFDCLFDPVNTEQVFERRKFSKAGAINSLALPFLAIFLSLVCKTFTDNELESYLQAFIQARSAESVTILLDRGVNIETTDSQQNTPLILACKTGSVSITNLLLTRGANVGHENKVGVTALHAAVEGDQNRQDDNLQCVRLLLARSANVNAKTHDNFTPLMLAYLNPANRVNYTTEDDSHTWNAFELIARELITAGCDLYTRNVQYPAVSMSLANFDLSSVLNKADLTVCDRSGNTPLHLSAQDGNLASVDALLKLRINSTQWLKVNARNNEMRTPLVSACWGSYRKLPNPRFMKAYDDVIRALIHAGADVNSRDKFGKTPLHYAATSGLNLRSLLEGGADRNSVDNEGNTAIHLAASSVSPSNVSDLIYRRPVGECWRRIVNAKNNKQQTPLMVACVHAPSLEGIIQVLIHSGCDVNSQDVEGMTALHHALKRELNIQSLLEIGSDPNIQDQHGNMALHIAASSCSLSNVEELLKVARVDINSVNNKKQTPLVLAYIRAPPSVNIVQALIQAGCDIDTPDMNGRTALHYAAELGINLSPLLKSFADLRVCDFRGNTALHLAASSGSLSCVNALITVKYHGALSSFQSKIDVNVENEDKRTALILACKNAPQPDDIIEALITAKCNVHTRDKDGKTALYYASERGLNLLPLLEGGADPNVGDHQDNTALHVTAANGFLSCVTQLLEVRYHGKCLRPKIDQNQSDGYYGTPLSHRININAQNIERRTPLILAYKCAPQPEDIVQTLLNHGCDANIQDIDGKTALHYAMKRGLNFLPLLEKGADPNGRDHEGNTALHLAVSSRCFLYVTALLNASAFDDSRQLAVYVNTKNNEQRTPLFLACGEVNPQRYTIAVLDSERQIKYVVAETTSTCIVDALMERGADPFVRDSKGRSAFDLAFTNRHQDTIITIVRNNSIKEETFSSDPSPLEIALKNHSLNIAKALLIGGYNHGQILNWIQSMRLSESWTQEEASKMDWMMEYASNPKSLQRLSCLAIRRSISRRIVSSVEHLPIPHTLQDYVSLKEMSCVFDLSASLEIIA